MLKNFTLAAAATVALALGSLATPNTASADVCLGPGFGGGFNSGFSRSSFRGGFDPYYSRYGGGFGPSFSQKAAFKSGFKQGVKSSSFVRPRRGFSFSLGF